jgi:hypothetical protein
MIILLASICLLSVISCDETDVSTYSNYQQIKQTKLQIMFDLDFDKKMYFNVKF